MSNRYVQTCLCGICMNKSDAGMGGVKTRHQEVSWMTVCIYYVIGTIHGFVMVWFARCQFQGTSLSWCHVLSFFLFYSGCLVELRRQELKDSLHHAAKCFISACANIGLKPIETYWNALKATPGKFCIWTKEAHQRRTPLNVFRISLS